jgi:hypothetical protein
MRLADWSDCNGSLSDWFYLFGREGWWDGCEGAGICRFYEQQSVIVCLKRPYAWEEVPMLNARINQAMDRGCNWNDGDILYSELEIILHREASSAVAIYCFGSLKTAFISNLIERKVIDITQLGCPQLEDICFPTISCTIACHNKSKYFCALRSTHSLAQWLHFHILSFQYAGCPLQPRCH